MASFPAMLSVRASMLVVGDVIRGKASAYNGTFLTFKYPVKVTEITDTRVRGVNSNGSAWNMDRFDSREVLIELKKGE